MSSGRNTPRNPEGTHSKLSLSEELALADMNAHHGRTPENDKTESRSGQEKEERRQRQAKRKHESGQREGEQKELSGKEEQELGQGKEGERQLTDKGDWRFLKSEGGIAKGKVKEQGEVYCSLSLGEAELGKGEMERMGIIKRREKKVTIVEQREAGLRIKPEDCHTNLAQKDLKVRSGKGEAKLGQEENAVAAVTGERKMDLSRGKREGRAGVTKDREKAHKAQEQSVLNLGREKAKADVGERQADAEVKQAFKGVEIVHGGTQTDFKEEITQAAKEHGEKEVDTFIVKGKSLQPLRKEDREGRRRVRRILNRLWERVVRRPHSKDQATIELLSEEIVAMVWARWRTMNVLQTQFP